MPESDRTALIRTQLTEAFSPTELEIVDESDQHIGHSGHGGAGHFRIRIVSYRFNDQSMLARHRLIYAALSELMKTEIHALSIDAVGTDAPPA